MFLIFQSIYTFAALPMDLIDAATSGLSDAVCSVMEPGKLRSLITDGIIAGVGGVLIFLPQIALLFLFLALLEEHLLLKQYHLKESQGITFKRLFLFTQVTLAILKLFRLTSQERSRHF